MYRKSNLLLIGIIGGCFFLGIPVASAQMITEPMFKSVQRVEEPEDEEVVRRRVIGFHYEMMERLVENPDEEVVVSFELFDDLTVLVEGVRVDRWSANEYTWYGEFVERQGNMSMEVNTHEQVVFTSFQVGNYSYRISHLDDEWYEVLELDLSGLQDHPPDWQEPIEEDPPGTFEPSERDTSFFGTSHTMRPPEYYLRDDGEQRTLTTDEEDILDVLMLYVEDAADSAGGVTDIVLNIRNAFSNTNTSFINSGVNARVRSVATRGVTWIGSDNPDMDNYINALEDAINDSDHIIYEWREDYGADIVGMVYTNAEGCGRVYEVKSDVTDDFRDKAVFVVKEGYCLGGNYTFAHEIGHLLGARHDWYMDDTDGSPFAYNHGYVHIDGGTSGTIGWRTIMAYNSECRDENQALEDEPNCTRLNYWSSPDNMHNGEPMGVASGDEAADNVRTLNNTIPTVSGFEDPAPVVYGIVTDLLTGDGMDEVEMAGIYGPVTDENGFYDVIVRKGKSVMLTPEVMDENVNGEAYEFDPSSPKWVENITSNVQQNFNAGIYYNISGRVIAMDEVDRSGVEMTGAPGGTTPVTDGFGRYDFDVLANWEGTIVPQKGDGLEFDPPEREYSNLNSDIENEDYEVSLEYHRITGTIEEEGTSQGIGNVALEGLPHPIPPYATTNIDGGYAYNLKHGWSGTVRPVRIGYRFEPPTRTYDMIDGDITHDYTAIPSAFADSGWPVYGSDAANSGSIAGPAIGDTVQWSVTLDGAETTPGGIGTPPVIDDRGTIFLASDDGTVYAFNEDGSDAWRRNMGKGVEISAPPAAGSGRLLYVPTIGVNASRLYQLEDEGSVRGFFSVNEPIHTTPAAAEKDTMYIGADDGHLYALRPSLFLEEEWSFQTGDMIRSSPAVGPEGTIYVGSDDGSMYAVNPDGSEKWSFETGARIRSAPTLDPDQGDGGLVYFGSDDGNLYAVDMATGESEWEYSTGGAVRSSVAVDSDGNLFFGSNDHHIYAVGPTGQPLGSYNTGGPVTASPAVSRDEEGSEIMYVGADEDRMYAFNISNISESLFSPLIFPLWDVIPPGPDAGITSAALTEGELYFAHGDELVALGGETEVDGEDDSSYTQFSFAGYDPTIDLTLEEAHIIVWMSEIGGPLGLGGPIDPNNPCPTGPVYLPRCTNEGGKFGESTPLLSVVPERDLILGVATGREEEIDMIASGRMTDGLIGISRTRLEIGSRSTIVVGGVTDPEAFVPNPDGRSTELNAFVKQHDRTRTSDGDGVNVYAGHFSTDSPSMEIYLEGEQRHAFGNIGYGEFSETATVPPGEYELVMVPEGSTDRNMTAQIQSFRVELTGREEQIGLLATGFMNPSRNHDGPSLGYTGITFDGEALETTRAGDISAELPQETVLEQNFPNPFNPVTRIRFAIPESSHVRLAVYNILGQHVTTLVDENREAGYHETTFDASGLSSGVYIYRLETGSFSETKQMLLMQ